ncbi:Protein of unknown function [Bacillus cytotoxicus]|uniref:Uncharacterized protein n=1 Tax=Bacillus cytotoxicus TaxID=580165 RepID=A0AAX2CL03_9BACI|nr:Protein of unknown function [Bacillus cytotoxicus]SCN41621.1 Protein of unknown function [Bacillus cytotoxicus]
MSLGKPVAPAGEKEFPALENHMKFYK